MEKKCEIAKNVEIDGEKYKVINPEDPGAAINRVLARHEGVKVITPQEYEELKSKTQEPKK